MYAHSTSRDDNSDWQPLVCHLRAVAGRAAALGEKFGAAKAAALAGWLHDLGKFSDEFQNYLKGRGSSPDHSTAGAQEVLGQAATGMDKLMAELVAYAIAGHHAGLPDKSGAGGSLNERRRKSIPMLDPIWREQVSFDAQGLLPASFNVHPAGKDLAPFQFAFLGRMVFSCLVDADRLDTEAFAARVEGFSIDRDWPALKDEAARLIGAFDDYMAAKRASLSEAVRNSELNRVRADILAHTRGKAALPKGVFTLDVPTGGGKTLASLAFALEHTRCWGMDRIVYAIPFTSVIEQAAGIFREVLGDEMVLEHHSSIDLQREQPEDKDRPHAQHLESKLRLATENWAAPVVVTTNVQLFESLFSHRTSRCRRLHNLCNAVIILDEVQTLPLHVLNPCVAALDELARNYGCTVVLCTATQPALKAPRFKGGFEIGADRELAPNPAGLHKRLRRVTLRQAGVLTNAELIGEVSLPDQGLVIVNSRGHARTLYLAAKAAGLGGLVHLTTRQTAADRQIILAEIKRRLAAGEPCRVIATSLVEAGVDFSFPRGWRAEAGLDSVIQAAGRVNREGRWSKEASILTLFRPAEAKPPAEIKAFAEAMGRVSPRHADLFSQAAIEHYFTEVYWQRGDGLDRTVLDSPDGRTPQAVMAQFLAGSGETNFAYRNVGENFRLIREGMEPVIIAKDEEPKATLRALRNGLPPGKAARQFQRYVVQVPPRFRAKLIDNGHAFFVEGFYEQFAVLMTESFYTPEQGLIWEKADELGLENFLL